MTKHPLVVAGFPHLLHGGDYNPQQWRDTPGGAKPAWVAQKYPETLRVNARRGRLLWGGRHNHCLTSPLFREKARLINTRLADRYGRHPNLALWHVNNEYNGDCHCPLCQDGLRAWPRERYAGDLGRLNHAGRTSFWSHTITDWSRIDSPSPIGEGQVHGLTPDWKRFTTDPTVGCFRAESAPLRERSRAPVAANLMEYHGPDYHKLAAACDVVSWDAYPAYHDRPEDLAVVAGHKLLVAPMLYLLRPGVAERVEAFVGLTGTYVARQSCDLIHAEGATTLAACAGQFYAGRPAVTVHRVGAGAAYYVAARLDDRFQTDFFGGLIDALKIPRASGATLPPGVAARGRTDGGRDYLFLLSFAPSPQTVALGGGTYADAAGGGPVVGPLELTVRLHRRVRHAQVVLRRRGVVLLCPGGRRPDRHHARPPQGPTQGPTQGPATPMPPAPVRPSNEPPRVPGVPTLWLVGDSTVHVGTAGQQGWGDPFAQMFDPAKVRVLNRAIGGRSSRTFITEGRWDDVLKSAKPGDFVMIQMGHNDGGPLSGDNRERGSIRGTGDETKDVVLTLGANKDKPYTVHTYGCYVGKYVTDATAEGMTPVVRSWAPHGPRVDRPSPTTPTPSPRATACTPGRWPRRTRPTTSTSLVWKTYAGKTPERIKAEFFTPAEPSNTHSSPTGAANNARCAVEGITPKPQPNPLPAIPGAGAGSRPCPSKTTGTTRRGVLAPAVLVLERRTRRRRDRPPGRRLRA